MKSEHPRKGIGVRRKLRHREHLTEIQQVHVRVVEAGADKVPVQVDHFVVKVQISLLLAALIHIAVIPEHLIRTGGIRRGDSVREQA